MKDKEVFYAMDGWSKVRHITKNGKTPICGVKNKYMRQTFEIEYHLGPVFLTARPELRFRGDLDKIIFSGFVGLGVKL